jgi:hypothetical protein
MVPPRVTRCSVPPNRPDLHPASMNGPLAEPLHDPPAWPQVEKPAFVSTQFR